MENAQEVMEVSQGENMLQVNEQANQMDQLAQNVDNLSVNPDAIVVQGEEERAVIEPQNKRMDEYEIPGCVKCMINACNDPWCNWCTNGFCHKGQLCKNIYSHFAMCGKETNFCKEYRLRGSQNGRFIRRIQN